MLGPFGAMVQRIESAPRRGLLRFLAGGGVAALIGAAPPGERVAAKKKKKKKKKKGCATCPSSSCPVQFTAAGGSTICSIGTLSPQTCTPCTSNSQCQSINVDFPHCVTAGQSPWVIRHRSFWPAKVTAGAMPAGGRLRYVGDRHSPATSTSPGVVPACWRFPPVLELDRIRVTWLAVDRAR